MNKKPKPIGYTLEFCSVIVPDTRFYINKVGSITFARDNQFIFREIKTAEDYAKRNAKRLCEHIGVDETQYKPNIIPVWPTPSAQKSQSR